MSADNWTICPACQKRHNSERRIAAKSLRDCYGKVTPEEYEKRRSVFEAESKEELKLTLREDYFFDMTIEGNFTACYQCYCDCGVEYRFKKEEKVAVEVEETE
jgi:hypothetical protein